MTPSPRDPDFEARYRTDPDPFRVRTSRYERRKLDIVLASLARERYTSAWDAACGTGDLALALTGRCDAVLATDAAPTAVRLTAEHAPAASTRAHRLPEQPAESGFDLVVLSEVCYYLGADDRAATYRLVDEVAAPDAELVAVTWRHEPPDAHVSGDAATAELVAALETAGWRTAVRHEDTDFVSVHLVRGEAATPPPGGDEPR